MLAMWTMEDFFAASKNLNTVVVRTIGAMGAMGLFLADRPLMAYAVSRRTREVGIRMAVGAKPGTVMRMFVRQGSWSSIVGLAAGLAASVEVGRLLQGLFPGTGGDAVTYVLVVPLIAAVTFMAAYLRRAGPPASIRWWRCESNGGATGPASVRAFGTASVNGAMMASKRSPPAVLTIW